MAFNFHYSTKARFDLVGILGYYLSLNREVARKYDLGITAQIEKIKKFPKSGRLVPEAVFWGFKHYREVIFEQFRIIYLYREKDLIIVRIVDSRRLMMIDTFVN